MEGWLRKRGQHVNLWRERYFILREEAGETRLLYFRKESEMVRADSQAFVDLTPFVSFQEEPRGSFVIGAKCIVGSVKETPSKLETKKLFSFKLQWTVEQAMPQSPPGKELLRESALQEEDAFDIKSSDDEGEDMPAREEREEKKSKRKKKYSRAKYAAGAAGAIGVTVLTGGFGLGVIAVAATVVGVGGAGVAITARKGTADAMYLAAESRETAEWWRANVHTAITKAVNREKDLLQLRSGSMGGSMSPPR
jgi:hypothetical protein